MIRLSIILIYPVREEQGCVGDFTRFAKVYRPLYKNGAKDDF